MSTTTQTSSVPSPSLVELLKFADLQMAAEAFLVDGQGSLVSGQALVDALVEGNDHASRFTEIQAKEFVEHWQVVDQCANTPTGFSGTLFRCIQDDPVSGAKKGELVMSFRSTEFIDDSARDNQATNALEIKETGFAWGQLRDMMDWYESLKADPQKIPPGAQLEVTGYSLGGHLASAFNLMYPGEAARTACSIRPPNGRCACMGRSHGERTTRKRRLRNTSGSTVRSHHTKGGRGHEFL